MARRYEEVVDLPTKLDLAFLQEVVAFLVENASVAEQRVVIKTTDSTIEETIFADAVAQVEPGDDVRLVSMQLVGPENRNGADIVWGVPPSGPSAKVVVGSVSRVEAYGVAEALRRFVLKNAPRLSTPPSVRLAPTSKRGAVELHTPQSDGGRDANYTMVSGSDLTRGHMILGNVRIGVPTGIRVFGRLRGWWKRKGDDVKVEILGGVVVAAILGLIAWIWVF